ncbi:hypothetical protein, partial [Pisciglobus halotolerans]
LIEQELKDPNYFLRDSNKQRLFSEEEIAVLEEILRLKHEKGLTVQEAVTFALYQADTSVTNGISAITASVTDVSADITATNLPIKVLKELMVTIEDQSNKIDNLVEENKEYKEHFEALKQDNAEQNKFLLEKIDQLMKSNVQQKKRKGFFSLFLRN